MKLLKALIEIRPFRLSDGTYPVLPETKQVALRFSGLRLLASKDPLKSLIPKISSEHALFGLPIIQDELGVG